MRLPRRASVVGFFAAVAFARLGAADWLPVDRADLAAERCVFDPGAGAEILVREKVVDDSGFFGASVREYVRIKIYDQRGVAGLDKVDIPFGNEAKITSIEARVIKRDGSIANLEKSAFFTRDVMRAGKVRVRVKSFSFPALEPGVIVEYRYEMRSGHVGSVLVPLQDERPTRLLRLRVRPFAFPGIQTHVLYSRIDPKGLTNEKGGFTRIEVTNLPAMHVEPYAPPEVSCRSWALFFFTLRDEYPELYWARVAVVSMKELEQPMTPQSQVKAAALKIVGDAGTQREKLERIHDFCRTSIKNLANSNSGYTPDQAEQLKKNATPAETLANGYGTPLDINALCIALARSVGVDAHFALCSDRSKVIFDRTLMWPGALSDVVVAADIIGEWIFCDPAASYLPCGHLRWQNEGDLALVLDGKDSAWIQAPRIDELFSEVRRTAQLKLDASGTLDGEIKIELTGHQAVLAKQEFEGKSPAECEDLLRERLQRRISTAEISSVVLEQADDLSTNMVMKFVVHIPSYASKVGPRLIFQPSFFEKGRTPWFTSSTREFDIFFSFPWTERDDVSIDMPSGYIPEEANSPENIPEGGSIRYDTSIVYSTKIGEFRYRRTFAISGVFSPVNEYPALKRDFDTIHRADEHAIILQPELDESPVANETASAATTPI